MSPTVDETTIVSTPILPTGLVIMSTSRFSPEEWDAVFVRFLSSGQTRRAFCSRSDVPYDAFRMRYRKSARFAGKRRGAPTCGADAAEMGEQIGEVDRRSRRIIGIPLPDTPLVDWTSSATIPTLIHGVGGGAITCSADFRTILEATGTDDKTMFRLERRDEPVGCGRVPVRHRPGRISS